MEKLKKNFEINYPLEWGRDDVTIEQLSKDLYELKKRGATFVSMEIEYGYDDCHTIDVKAYVNRLETDDEFNERVAHEKANQELLKRREMAELERLKKKYNQ